MERRRRKQKKLTSQNKQFHRAQETIARKEGLDGQKIGKNLAKKDRVP